MSHPQYLPPGITATACRIELIADLLIVADDLNEEADVECRTRGIRLTRLAKELASELVSDMSGGAA